MPTVCLMVICWQIKKGGMEMVHSSLERNEKIDKTYLASQLYMDYLEVSLWLLIEIFYAFLFLPQSCI